MYKTHFDRFLNPQTYTHDPLNLIGGELCQTHWCGVIVRGKDQVRFDITLSWVRGVCELGTGRSFGCIRGQRQTYLI
jgi:hypothetical protein